LILLLAESSLELVPKDIAAHPAVVSDARRRRKSPTEIILDRAKHHFAMAKLPNAHKRGRPDIVHQSLLLFQYSILNYKYLGSIIIHTISNKIIYMSRKTRIPKNYNNFIGLFEQLLVKGKAPVNGKPLLIATDGDLRTALRRLGDNWVLLHEKGRRVNFDELGKALYGSIVVVGGFPRGDFENRWLLECAADVVRVGDFPLDAAQVIYRAVTAVEKFLGLI